MYYLALKGIRPLCAVNVHLALDTKVARAGPPLTARVLGGPCDLCSRGPGKRLYCRLMNAG